MNINKMTIKNISSKQMLITGLLLFSLSLVACDSQKQSSANANSSQVDKKDAAEKKDKKKEKAPVPVEVATVSRGDIQKTYRSITTLEAENEVQVVARSTGILNEIMVEEGDHVVKGQLMAQLDVEQLSLEVAQLRATSSKLKKELERQTRLFAKQLGSRDALDRAKFEYQSQLAQYKLSKLKLDYAGIRAPISGIVTERRVKAGNFIRNNDPMFRIVDLASLKAVLYLPEKELVNVKKQQQVLLKIDALGDKIISGKIERIRPSIDSQTGTFKVVAHLDNSEHQLRAGMFGTIELVFDRHQNSLLVEQQAVITQDNRSHVFVVKDNKAIQTPVKIGFRHKGIYEIIEGLSEKDQVITTGQQIIKHQTLVEIVNDDPQVVEPQVASQQQKETSSNNTTSSAQAIATP